MAAARFRQLKPITPDYASLPILEGFNWEECLADVEATQLYLVVFRSVRRQGADPARLKHFDDRAYAEARRARGLLHYFRGHINQRRECLSFCIWRTPDSAQAATRLSAHEEAARLTEEMYESFELERWILVKWLGTGRLEILPFQAQCLAPRALLLDRLDPSHADLPSPSASAVAPMLDGSGASG